MALEEADQLQIFALSQAEISIPKNIKSAKDFTPEVLIFVVVSALKLISPDNPSVTSLVERLPANVAARHRIATSVSNEIKNLGFTGEVGYNQLLYSNERDVRKLLSWIVQMLPKSDDVAGGSMLGPAGFSSFLFRNVGNWKSSSKKRFASCSPSNILSMVDYSSSSAFISASDRLNSRTPVGAIPVNARKCISDLIKSELQNPPAGNMWSLDSSARVAGTIRDSNGEANISVSVFSGKLKTLETVSKNYHNDRVGRWGPRLVHGRKLFPSAALDIVSNAFNRRTAFSVEVVNSLGTKVSSPVVALEDTKVRTEEDIARERELELATLTELIGSLQMTLEQLTQKRGELEGLGPILEEKLKVISEESKQLERRYLIHRNALEWLPDADTHIQRLASELLDLQGKLKLLHTEWSNTKNPILTAIAAEEARMSASEAQTLHLESELNRMRLELAEMAKSHAVEEERIKKMTEQWNKVQEALNSDDGLVTRAVYGKRLLDVVRQIRKQKDDISKVVSDVNKVRGDFDSIMEKVKRSAKNATAIMENAASEKPKDPAYRLSLKHLLNLLDNFSKLYDTVSSIGQIENETRDIDNRIEQLTARNDAANTAHLLRDLQQLQAENASLQKS